MYKLLFLAFFSLLCVSGCESMGTYDEVKQALNAPAADGSGTILTDAIEAVPHVVASPFAFSEWGKIVAAFIAGAGALFGWNKVRAANEAKAQKVAVVVAKP